VQGPRRLLALLPLALPLALSAVAFAQPTHNKVRAADLPESATYRGPIGNEGQIVIQVRDNVIVNIKGTVKRQSGDKCNAAKGGTLPWQFLNHAPVDSVHWTTHASKTIVLRGRHKGKRHVKMWLSGQFNSNGTFGSGQLWVIVQDKGGVCSRPTTDWSASIT
jgi:hypothetical protein